MHALQRSNRQVSKEPAKEIINLEKSHDVGTDHDVGRYQITMDHTFAEGIAHRLTHLNVTRQEIRQPEEGDCNHVIIKHEVIQIDSIDLLWPFLLSAFQ